MSRAEKRFTIHEAAQLLSLGEATIRRWTASGRLKGTKDGTRASWLFKRQDLLKAAEPVSENQDNSSTPTQPSASPSAKAKKTPEEVPVVGLGASAGGLEAFTLFLQAVDPAMGMAYILVQHLDPEHKSSLPELLAKVSTVPVKEATNNCVIEPNKAYVIPANKTMRIVDGKLRLQPRSAVQAAPMSIDTFFSSLAQTRKNRAIGIVLSGTAMDGTQGLAEIKAEGGITFAQDEKTALYQGMPKSAIAAKVVDFVLSPDKMADQLLRISKHPYLSKRINSEEKVPHDTQNTIQKIVPVLAKATGVDFSSYKQTTIERRIFRRMALQKITHLSEYLEFIKAHPEEQQALFSDLLITVTSFFRDPDTFQALQNEIFPALMKEKPPAEPFRIWVAGTSSGEEAYSIAMSLLEYVGDTNQLPYIQIFATDLSEQAIETARMGIYPRSALHAISPGRLSRFFTVTGKHYQVNKEVRDLCIFATHNLLSDPPFSRMDLISCRNVLIYLEPQAQKKLLATFHYALRHHGKLMLGKSEVAGAAGSLFTVANKKCQIYTKNPTSTNSLKDIIPKASAKMPSGQSVSALSSDNGDAAPEQNVGKMADTLLLSTYVPASVVVDHRLEALQFRGQAEQYLKPPTGKATFNLLKMVHKELYLPLRSALLQAQKTNLAVTKPELRFRQGNDLHSVSIEVVPLSSTPEPPILVVFREQAAPTHVAESPTQSDSNDTANKDHRILQLENELSQSRQDTEFITHREESANEELQSANEELQSSNEELQSLNEELETSKEELQSANEELTTINHELRTRNDQIVESVKFNQAINDTIRESLIVLDDNLSVMSANRYFYRTFQASPEQTERQYLYDLGDGQWNIPELRTMLIEMLAGNRSMISSEVTHTFPQIGHRTMLLNARRIRHSDRGLILLAIQDITKQKVTQQQLEESEERYRLLVENAKEIMTLRDMQGRLIYASPSLRRTLGCETRSMIGERGFESVHPDDKDALDKYFTKLKKAKDNEKVHGRFHLRHKEGHWITLDTEGQLIFDEHGKPQMIVGVSREVAEPEKKKPESRSYSKK